mgnify:CR=1 FL=1
MTESEIQDIVVRVLDEIRSDSVTIEELLHTNVLKGEDLVELNNGRRTSLLDIKEYLDQNEERCIEVLKKGDKDLPTDNNVFSALRTLTEIANNNEVYKKIFLRKDQPEVAEYLLTLLEGLISEGFVEANSGLIVRSSKKTTSLSNALIEDSNKDSISHDLIEEENTGNLSTSLLEVTAPSGTIGSLDNVDPQADTALIGSLLAKGSESWAPIAPVQSGLTDYEHMLIPVFHTIRQQWIFIPADRFGEVVPPVSSGFPYVLPLTLL